MEALCGAHYNPNRLLYYTHIFGCVCGGNHAVWTTLHFRNCALNVARQTICRLKLKDCFHWCSILIGRPMTAIRFLLTGHVLSLEFRYHKIVSHSNKWILRAAGMQLTLVSKLLMSHKYVLLNPYSHWQNM